ncbi:glucose-6-phosphate dehydrogenase assembly protein OpcA [Pelagicoccus albus]|uniref:Glucose-6-phosphate dehydrogenase assembly protein OpcA n=1 Tax=Pelagicoccus albus TaxID=415222 RepID=A0A7X1E834_9BACT|nr:glucose-6-phosphate dehydrogenase assembly protein OpcA [Pelagicoccus albus]MBC2605841.1 glucose-6-phosphate dehydrogenase assembly protein OpcA [Pelagicoccus albus]
MSDTNTVYEALPGLSVPLGNAMKELTAMWSPEDESGKSRDNEYRASRMNLIVHIGFEASVEEAKELFQTVIEFSHRYPCRMIVLCPQPESWESKEDMSCKIFSECVFGKGAGGMSCCEVLILGYTLHDRRFLENQVSIFLEADLPTYYWPTRFGSAEALSDYKFFFSQAERILFDSTVESFSLDQLEVPKGDKVHDLSFSRLLPVRQCMGQFLSAFPKETIVEGLQKVTLAAPPSFKCEGKALMKWVDMAVTACFGSSEERGEQVAFEQSESEEGAPVIRFEYDSDRYITFTFDLSKSEAHVEGDLGNGKQELTTGVRLLDAETALAEALFFG